MVSTYLAQNDSFERSSEVAVEYGINDLQTRQSIGQPILNAYQHSQLITDRVYGAWDVP